MIKHRLLYYSFFFFSSRRRHTRSKRDWSSDVCSSDLTNRHNRARKFGPSRFLLESAACEGSLRRVSRYSREFLGRPARRSEERRVGKECRSRVSPYDEKKKKKKEEEMRVEIK